MKTYVTPAKINLSNNFSDYNGRNDCNDCNDSNIFNDRNDSNYCKGIKLCETVKKDDLSRFSA